MAGFRGAQKLSKIFDLKATHPPMIAGIIGAIVDIGKRGSNPISPSRWRRWWSALPFVRVRGKRTLLRGI